LEFGGAELSEKVANLFNELFPLVLLAIEEDPLPAIQDYLQVGNGAPVAPPPLPPPVPTPPPIQPEYPLATCAAETGFDVPTLETWVRAVNRKGQAIIYGPPGTGKTIGAIKGGLTLHKCAKSKRLSMPPVHGNGFLLTSKMHQQGHKPAKFSGNSTFIPSGYLQNRLGDIFYGLTPHADGSVNPRISSKIEVFCHRASSTALRLLTKSEYFRQSQTRNRTLRLQKFPLVMIVMR